jgi:hypothetical protein
MAKKQPKKTPSRRVNLDFSVVQWSALETHRKALALEKGMPVTISDAIRDAVLRVRQLPFAGLDK